MANTVWSSSPQLAIADSGVLLSIPMHPVEATHWTLVQKRTRIRHDKLTGLWLQRCWLAARRLSSRTSPDPSVGMSRDEYDGVYRRLLTAMTIGWDDDQFDAIVELMWRRDAMSFQELDFARFSCSIFAFAEMWVESLEVVEYTRILQLMHRILATSIETQIIRRSNPTSLAAFHDALRHETQLAAMNLSIGKSTVFDPDQYEQSFGRVVSEAVSSVVVSNPRHLHRRHTGTILSPAIRQEILLGSHARQLRPRSCSAFVRIDDTAQRSANAASLSTKHLVVSRPRIPKELHRASKT